MEKELISKGSEVTCKAVESKNDIREIFYNLKSNNTIIDELHFIGHSGMYGPMYGTIEYPEQFSPWEWKQLDIPFKKNATAYFHACRTARWFAPFFSNTFGVKTYGYHLYTTISKSKSKYIPVSEKDENCYIISCKGHKSHGYIESLKKRLRIQPAEDMIVFESQSNTDRSYNKVAELYNNVFQDIKVREDEWNWLSNNLPDLNGKTILDIGCGNGALLKEFANNIEKGIGIDASKELISWAKKNHKKNDNVEFKLIDSPQIPLEDNSVDIAISLLSFRYLDWDPLMNELKRVLKPSGQLFIIDMVTCPLKVSEWGKFLISKNKHYKHRKKFQAYYSNLQKLVSHPNWKEMLKHNPIRSEHEMKWYLESRFPNQKVETINIGYHSRILAFKSGPINEMTEHKLTYP